MPGAGCSDVSFRSATTDDVDWLVDLRVRTMGPHLEAAGEVVSPEEQRARVVHDFGRVRIVSSGAEPIGMVKVVKAQDQWRLVQIQLVPERQGNGIGGRIVAELLRDARRENVPVVLSVLKVNPARRLYRRLGFDVVGETERSLEMRADPGTDDIVDHVAGAVEPSHAGSIQRRRVGRAPARGLDSVPLA